MRTFNQFIFLAFIGVLCLSCSSTKLSSSYKSDDVETIRGKKILVVSRTPQSDIRTSYEKEIVKSLKAEGFNATASHAVLPDLEPLTNKTVERIENTISTFRKEGFDILVLTSLKDVEEQEIILRQEGYSSFTDYYGNKYVTLKGYYDDVNAPPRLPALETELEPVTKKTITFVLEAVTYNLALPEEQRLLSVVTTEITNPDSGPSVRKGFAKIVANQLK